jgi:hypothetical protein
MNTIEIDLNSFSKEELTTLIQISVERNLTFNDLIVKILEDHLNYLNSK